jgi:VanZ family protein
MITPSPGLIGFLHRRRRLVLAVCVLAWASALTATHIPGPDMPDLHVGDKYLHVVGFLGLSGLFWATLTGYGKGTWVRLGLMLAVMPLYAAFDELTQPYFQRTADVDDWISDAAGTVAALIVAESAFALELWRCRRGAPNTPLER